MTELAYTGFRFTWDRPDANAPNGSAQVPCLVIARSISEAQRILTESVTGSPRGVVLVSSSPEIYREAQAAGLNEGEGRAF